MADDERADPGGNPRPAPKTSRVRLGLVSVASPLEVGAGDAPEVLARLQAAFSASGFPGLELVTYPHPVTNPTEAVAAGRTFHDEGVGAICVAAAAWFEDYLVVDLLEECRVPIIAWARPGMETGSLCGMQQLGYLLKALGWPYCVLFDELGAVDSLDRAWDYARAATLRARLRRARVGHLGHRVEGMTETTPHELALKQVLGPRVVGIDSHVFLQRAAAVPPESVAGRWQEIKGQVGAVSASEEAGITSVQAYVALKGLIEERGLSAVAFGCYPNIFGVACLAASLLAEEGVPIACEGDVNGAVGMLMLTALTGQPVHCTDTLDPIPDDDAIVFSHCGSGGFSLASNHRQITLAPVRLMDHGLCCMFPARPGPVTMVNLIPSLSGYRLAVAAGEALKTEMVFPGNPLKVRFTRSHRDVLNWIVAEGLGHHWVAAYGNLQRALRDLADMAGCEWVGL